MPRYNYWYSVSVAFLGSILNLINQVNVFILHNVINYQLPIEEIYDAAASINKPFCFSRKGVRCVM